MRSWKALARRLGPKPPDFGSRLFAQDDAVSNYANRAVLRAPDDARELLRGRPALTDEQLSAKLYEVAKLFPLSIDPPFSIEVECAPVQFRGGDPTYWHRATVKVPYQGSGVLWLSRLEPGFDSELNGKVGNSAVRIRSVLEDENAAPLKEHVVEQLAAVRERLHHQDSIIEVYNEQLDKRLRGWVANNPAVIEELRRKAARRGGDTV